MLLKTKKRSTRVCVGLFFLFGGIEYGEELLEMFVKLCKQVLIDQVSEFCKLCA